VSEEQKIITRNMETLEKLHSIEKILYRKSVPEERLRLIREIVGENLVDSPISQGLVDKLTQDACFAADSVAITNRHDPNMTGAQQTRAVVRRTIEFLIGNNIVVVVDHNDMPRWIKMDPPYDENYLEPTKENNNG
jgi:hypothetical protein